MSSRRSACTPRDARSRLATKSVARSPAPATRRARSPSPSCPPSTVANDPRAPRAPCSARATAPTPVPCSPWISTTGRSAVSTLRATAAVACERNGNSSTPRRAWRRSPEVAGRRISSSCRTRARMPYASNGLARNSTGTCGGTSAATSTSRAACSNRSGTSGSSRSSSAPSARSSRGTGGSPSTRTSGVGERGRSGRLAATRISCSCPSTIRSVSLTLVAASTTRTVAMPDHPSK